MARTKKVKTPLETPPVDESKLSDEPKAPEERLTPPSDQLETPPVKVEGDYLRQYQYRKQTEFGSKDSDPQPGSKAVIMKKFLLSQPRVRIFIPRQQGADPNIRQSVTLNSYRLDLPKNTYIDVPLEVANIITESLNQTEAAILRGQITGDKEKEAALNG